MKSFAMALDLVDDPVLIAEYEQHHQEVWPEVLKGLEAAGVRRMRIYRSGTRLFMHFEAPDDFNPGTDYQRYTEDPRCAEWDRLMRTYQLQVPVATDDTWWTPMSLIFDFSAE